MGNVVFLGVEGSGKTTLAMALAKAFARRAGEGWYLRPSDRGAYTFATLAPDDFAADGFPSQTSAVREMTWTVERDGAESGAIQILDYPGEIYRLAFLSPEGESDPDAFRARVAANADELAALNRAIDEASDLYVLFNLQDALDLRNDDSNRSAVWVTNECLTRLKSLPKKPHVTLVFTQVDRYQTDDDFLHSFTPAELDLIGHDHPDVDWMMVSVLVPPDSEFGIDAFVRRVTGLAAFGVPDGRPRARAATGGALARLAAQRREARAPARPAEESPAPAHGEGRAPARPVEGSLAPAHGEGRAPARPEATGARHGFLWLVFLAVLVFGAAYFIVTYLGDGRLLSWGKRRLAASCGENVESNEIAKVAYTNANRSGETPLPPAGPLQGQRSGETPLPPAETPQGPAEPHQSPAAPTNVAVSAHDELAAEVAAAIAAARECDTLQEARETLSYAADALNSADALYERARIDDMLGWGAFVRTREEKSRNPKWHEWLRRIDLLGEKKASIMLHPATNYVACRKQSLADYRAAAARGVPAAVDALARHALHENDKDIRRSSPQEKK